MTIKKKIYKLRGGTVLDIDEFHDGRYGGPGGTKKEKREVHCAVERRSSESGSWLSALT